MKLNETNVIRIQNTNTNIVSIIKVFKNPTKQQLQNLILDDKYKSIRCFILEKDIYCWCGFRLTHQEAKNALLQQEGLEIDPLCGITIFNNRLKLANSWNNIIISEINKEKILHNFQLEYLFGKNYTIEGL